MAGIGPEWVHTHANGISSNSIAGEAVLDLMFWPRLKHTFGWYLETGYDYGFGVGHEQSAGISGGFADRFSVAPFPHVLPGVTH
ncbi:MAG TPA: hypothetical protein VGG45_20655 [Terracidiphilus sp.]|jgi:hypothetical protein